MIIKIIIAVGVIVISGGLCLCRIAAKPTPKQKKPGQRR